MKVNFFLIATLAASAFASPAAGDIAERQVAPGLDELINGLTTVVSDIVHGLYGSLGGVQSSTASIAQTQQSVDDGEISKEEGQAKIQDLIKDLQDNLTSGATKLQDAADSLGSSS